MVRLPFFHFFSLSCPISDLPDKLPSERESAEKSPSTGLFQERSLSPAPPRTALSHEGTSANSRLRPDKAPSHRAPVRLRNRSLLQSETQVQSHAQNCEQSHTPQVNFLSFPVRAGIPDQKYQYTATFYPSFCHSLIHLRRESRAEAQFLTKERFGFPGRDPDSSDSDDTGFLLPSDIPDCCPPSSTAHRDNTCFHHCSADFPYVPSSPAVPIHADNGSPVPCDRPYHNPSHTPPDPSVRPRFPFSRKSPSSPAPFFSV